MRIPEGITEQEIIDTVARISRRLAPTFKFGYLTVDDIKQQIWIFACGGLDSYDTNKGPLENFLFRHIRNRLINFKRDNYKRTDSPCKLCYGSISGHTGHPDRLFCEKYTKWAARNTKKQNVLLPLDIGNISDEAEPRTRVESVAFEAAMTAEILQEIDRILPIELRSYYLQMKEGISIPKARRVEIEEVVSEVLHE